MQRLWVACLLVACAHTPNLAVRPDPSPPEGSTVETFKGHDGTELYMRKWLPAGEARAAFVIMHGLKDHSANYAAFAKQLVDAGYAVFAFDLRGHGRSAGKRVAPASWMDYVDDLDGFLKGVEQQQPGKKVFLFGHSMGGAIAALTAERHEPKLAGLVLSAPAIALDAPPLLIAATVMSGVLSPKAPALKLANKDFSSDPAVVKALGADPLVSQPPGPASTAAGLVAGIRRIWANADRLTMPLLALHGTRDKLTAPSGSRALVRVAASTDKTLEIYDGFFHDLLHEPRGAEVAADILAWLDPRVSGAAPPAPPPLHAGKLAGDPRGWTQAVLVGAGVAQAGGDTSFTGELAFNIARPRPLGYHAALLARLGPAKELALRPVGVAVRSGGAVLGLSGGAALVGGESVSLAFSLAWWLEVPVGPLHLGGLAEWTRLASGSTGGVAGADLVYTGATLRLGRDRRYWPGARAGVGPYVGGGLALTDGANAFTLTAGLQLYGAD
jgi:alpha-beta hydrolase superfamily lysophospholipase